MCGWTALLSVKQIQAVIIRCLFFVVVVCFVLFYFPLQCCIVGSICMLGNHGILTIPAWIFWCHVTDGLCPGITQCNILSLNIVPLSLWLSFPCKCHCQSRLCCNDAERTVYTRGQKRDEREGTQWKKMGQGLSPSAFRKKGNSKRRKSVGWKKN